MLQRALIVLAAAIAAAGCATAPPAVKASSVYDAEGKKVIGASTDSFETTHIYSFGQRDVYDTAHRALVRKGFQIEREDRGNGVILASGMIPNRISGAPAAVPFTASVRIKQISRQPQTELRLMLDAHWNILYGSLELKLEAPSRKLGPELIADIQKLLYAR